MDRPTMRTEIRFRLGEEVEDFWSNSAINRAIDEAIKRFTLEEKWPWLYRHKTGVSLPANQEHLDLETDIAFERHFDIWLKSTSEATAVLPRRVSPPEGFRLRAGFTQTGTPRYYYIASASVSGTNITSRVYFVPKPHVTYSVEYQYIFQPAPMDDTLDPPIPDVYHEAIVTWATGSLWLRELNGGGKAQEQYNLYNAVLDQARQDMKELALDEDVAWGKQEPEWMPVDADQYSRMRIPPTLG